MRCREHARPWSGMCSMQAMARRHGAIGTELWVAIQTEPKTSAMKTSEMKNSEIVSDTNLTT